MNFGYRFIFICFNFLFISYFAGCSSPQEQVEETNIISQNQKLEQIKTTNSDSSQCLIDKSKLKIFLDLGPAYFLKIIIMDPFRINGEFAGFKISKISEPSFQKKGIEQNDIIFKVNQIPLKRPDDFWNIWKQLYDADELNIEYTREDIANHLIFTCKIIEN